MRAFVTVLALVIALGWVGYELRPRYREVSNVLFGFAILFAAALTAAFFGLLGGL